MGLRYLIRNIVKRSDVLRQNRAASIGEINAKKRNGIRVSLHLPWSMCCSPPFHKGFCSRALRQQLVLQTPQTPRARSLFLHRRLRSPLSPSNLPESGQEFCNSMCLGWKSPVRVGARIWAPFAAGPGCGLPPAMRGQPVSFSQPGAAHGNPHRGEGVQVRPVSQGFQLEIQPDSSPNVSRQRETV